MSKNVKSALIEVLRAVLTAALTLITATTAGCTFIPIF